MSSTVDPADVRWVFLSHDDGDHTGATLDVLDVAPSYRRRELLYHRAGRPRARALPIERMVWLEEGTCFDAGDRRLRLFRPPIFDGPTTRGLYDERTGVMWAVDSFAALTTGAVLRRADLPPDLYGDTFALFNSMISPWHQWLDPKRYAATSTRSRRSSRRSSPRRTARSSPAVHRRCVRTGAGHGRPAIVPPPGQETLDALVAQVLAVPAAV